VGFSGKNAGSTLNQQVRGRPFAAGNPGRPRGARNKSTLAVEQMLNGEAEALTRKAIEMALDGDGPAMKLCLDRLLSPRRDRSITFELPIIESAADLPNATAAMLRAVASGEITPSEAAELSRLVDAHVNAIKTADLANRLARLEEASA
jgi:hypothetical protein